MRRQNLPPTDTDPAIDALVLLAHPYPAQSRANRMLLSALDDIPGVRINDLYGLYPDFHIDVAREQELLRQARIVVFQHPMYWYSAPALLKEWQDVVLARGFAIGRSGNALRGKSFLHVVTIGGSAHAYRPEGTHRYSTAELLRPFEQMANLCGMRYEPPITLFDAHHCPLDSLQRQADSYARRLRDLLAEIPAEPTAAGSPQTAGV